MSRPRRLEIETTQGYAGTLSRESQYVFNYRTERPDCEIALAMPLRAQSYAAHSLPGVLRQNLPEGYLLDCLRERFGKAMKLDDFNLFTLIGGNAIGRVHCVQTQAKASGESLREILTCKGTEALFADLLERYAPSSGVSGVQPKVLIPERAQTDVIDKSTFKSRNLIIKSGGDDFPGLAENEFHCMSMAQAAGLETPDFWLSDNAKLFVIARFDCVGDRYLGFEDMTSLMDRRTEDKYVGSYEAIAKAVALFASPAARAKSLAELFKSIVLSVLLRNGDAHLKNFGLLYTHPGSSDCRLSPVYDIVNTTMYLPKDTLALKLDKTKAWPSRKTLARFGRERCLVAQPEKVIEEIQEAIMAYRPRESSATWLKLRDEIEAAAI